MVKSLLLAAMLASRVAAAERGLDHRLAPFIAPGAVIAFVGDSITHNHPYHQMVQLFLATRYPGRGIWTVNNGFSGETASGVQSAYDWDVRPQQPTAAFIHFGMNDVGRDAFKGRQEPFTDAERAQPRQRYRDALAALGRRLQADNVRVAVLSPTIFDDTMRRWDNAGERPHLDAELVRFGGIGRALAAEQDWPAIDLHAPLSATNAVLQAADPTKGLTNDRVHPSWLGHQVMAATIIDALADRRQVYDVSLGADGSVLEAQGATVIDAAAAAGELSFSLAESALPYPEPGLTAELNRMRLRIRDLPAGRWSLAIDGQAAAEGEPAIWADGIDLSGSDTPQRRLALELRRLVLERKLELEKQVRMQQCIRRMLSSAKVAGLDWDRPDPAAIVSALDAYVARRTAEGKPPQMWDAHVVKTGRVAWVEQAAIREELSALRRRLAELPPIARHRYILRRSPANP